MEGRTAPGSQEARQPVHPMQALQMEQTARSLQEKLDETQQPAREQIITSSASSSSAQPAQPAQPAQQVGVYSPDKKQSHEMQELSMMKK